MFIILIKFIECVIYQIDVLYYISLSRDNCNNPNKTNPLSLSPSLAGNVVHELDGTGSPHELLHDVDSLIQRIF